LNGSELRLLASSVARRERDRLRRARVPGLDLGERPEVDEVVVELADARGAVDRV